MTINEVLENQYVKLGTAAVVIAAVMAYVRYDTAWRSHIDHQLQSMTLSIEHIHTKMEGTGGWHKRDMQLWTSETALRNPSWTPAPVRNEFDR